MNLSATIGSGLLRGLATPFVMVSTRLVVVVFTSPTIGLVRSPTGMMDDAGVGGSDVVSSLLPSVVSADTGDAGDAAAVGEVASSMSSFLAVLAAALALPLFLFFGGIYTPVFQDWIGHQVSKSSQRPNSNRSRPTYASMCLLSTSNQAIFFLKS
jgi:hypothetical protein